MTPRRSIAIGDVFGRLRVVERIPGAVKNCVCECECGNTTTVPGWCLAGGATRSCGCLRRERTAEENFKHGEACVGKVAREFKLWLNMIDRCHNQKSRSFPRYGGRGISVCDRWRYSYPNFLEDMGRRPSPKHTLDRYPNNNGNYEPGNVRWATAAEQSRNTGRNRVLAVNGIAVCAADAAPLLGIPYKTLIGRLNRLGIAKPELSRRRQLGVEPPEPQRPEVRCPQTDGSPNDAAYNYPD